VAEKIENKEKKGLKGEGGDFDTSALLSAGKLRAGDGGRVCD
jgi:hypothetical protein